MNNIDFALLPLEFYISLVLVVAIAVTGIVIVIFYIIKNKDIRLRNIEIVENSKKELYQTEGKNVLDNQTSNAHHLLKKIWIDIYNIGRRKFSITDSTELFLLEDIAHLIEGKLNYEVKNDLTRNHITEKGDLELAKYSDAKASGYYSSVNANLFTYNNQLPKYDLPQIMEEITLDDFKHIFSEIYFNARKIASGKQ